MNGSNSLATDPFITVTFFVAKVKSKLIRFALFEQVCSRMFEANPVGMFISFGDSRLVHPNSNSKYKLRYFEMAGRIVSKCLFESSLGSAYRQIVKARFTR